MRSVRSLIFVIVFFVNLSSTVILSHAWGPIAHYSLGKAAGYGDNVCMNLPDAWPSREYQIIISPWFAWTHAVQITGMNSAVPGTPIYPEDGRYPGYDMQQIVSKKINDKTTEKINSAKGFIGHNAMDSNVHYTYFRGGSLSNWLIQHSDKEEWAEYVIYENMADGDFDSEGYPTSFYGVSIQRNNAKQILIPCSANPDVIQLAQKAYRKNRRLTTAYNDAGRFLEVDTIQTINNR
ncbi:hypothetical protein EG832_17490, partial [bacterium]|nr:hypothetical protein [bacterium]